MNVKYSPNLGDGLLSECLESVLIAQGADPMTGSIDLAAREAYGDSMAMRGTAMTVLDALPPALRRRAVRIPLALQSARKWGPHYARGLDGRDAAIIGGGNLIADLDLNFPTKLALAMDHLARRRMPVVIFGCGMGRSFSSEGLRRLTRAFTHGNLRAVFLRDAASRDEWNRRLAGPTGIPAEIVRDPGLLSAAVHPAPARPAQAAPRIGLGLMSHIAIRYHARASIGPEALGQWYLDLAHHLVRAGAEVTAFTNGSPEDVSLARDLHARLAAIGADVSQPRTPTDLAQVLAGFDAIAAYRMHAVIGAYAQGVPALALAWDPKLDSFMGSVGRSDWMADPGRMAPEAAASRLLEAAAAGLEQGTHARVLAEARADIARAHDVLRAAVAAASGPAHRP